MKNTLRRVPAGEREPFLPLLLLADESLGQVRSYMNEGDLYVYSDGSGIALRDMVWMDQVLG